MYKLKKISLDHNWAQFYERKKKILNIFPCLCFSSICRCIQSIKYRLINAKVEIKLREKSEERRHWITVCSRSISSHHNQIDSIEKKKKKKTYFHFRWSCIVVIQDLFIWKLRKLEQTIQTIFTCFKWKWTSWHLFWKFIKLKIRNEKLHFSQSTYICSSYVCVCWTFQGFYSDKKKFQNKNKRKKKKKTRIQMNLDCIIIIIIVISDRTQNGHLHSQFFMNFTMSALKRLRSILCI